MTTNDHTIESQIWIRQAEKQVERKVLALKEIQTG